MKTQARQPKQQRLWPYFAVCVAAAIAASLFAPISLKEYVLYITSRLGWELPAAFLTASSAVVVALFMARRSHASGIVAVSIFLSVLLHMMLVPVFGVVKLKYVTVVAGHEIKREIAFGLPSLSESIAGQELRAMFNETTLPDARSFQGEKKSGLDLLDAKPAKAEPKLKQNDFTDRQPGKLDLADQLASKPKQSVKETLAAIPATTPKTVQPQLARIQPLKSGDEALRQVQLVTKELKVQPDTRARLDMPKDPSAAQIEPKLKDAQRDLSRESIEMVDGKTAAPKVQEVMRATTIANKQNLLDMKAAAVTVAKAVPQPAARLEPKQVLDVSHQTAATPEAPAPKMLTREVATARPGAGTASLADAYSATSERRPTVDDASMRDTRKNAQLPAELVRIQGTVASAEGGRPAAPTGERTLNARDNLRSERVSRAVVGAEVAMAAPRAQVDLRAGQAAPETSFAASRSTKTTVSSAKTPGIQETLSVDARPMTAGQPIMSVGGTARTAQNVSAETMGAATAQRSVNRPVGIAASRAETGIENVPDSPAVRSSGPAAADLSRHAAYAAGTEVKEVSAYVPSSKPRTALPGSAEVGLAGSVGGTAIASERGSLVNLGTAALPAAGGVQAAPGVSGAAGGSREDRQEFSAAKRQTGFTGTEMVQANRPALGETLGSSVSVEPRVSGDTSSLPASDIGTGVRPRTAVSVEETADVGSATVAGGRADSPGVRIVPGVAQAAKSIEGASTGGGGASGAPQRSGSANIVVGKATGATVELSGAERGLAHVSAPTSVRYSEPSGSLVGASEVSAGGLSAAKITSGIRSDVSLSQPAGSGIAKSDRVSIGIAAKQATGGVQDGGRGDAQPAVAGGQTGRSDVRAAKAGGRLAADAGPDTAGSGRRSVALDSFGDSLSLSRAPARLDVDSGGGGGGNSGLGIPTGIVGARMGTAAPKTIITSELADVPTTVPEKAIYKLRDPGKRKEFIAELGGSEKTELGVEHALAWLAGTQSDDGRWDIDGFKTLSACGGPGDQINEDVALTGLCLLSYLGAGYTHVKGDHKETVRKAVNWLVVGQKEDGNLQREGQMYGQAIGTAALCECYSMTADKRLLEPIQKAVDFILKAQNPGAGWRYQPRKDNDTSVTGWQVLALKSAMIAGIKFPPEHFEWVEKWLDSVRRGDGGGLYTYMPGHGATPTMTAEGWFCQLLMKEQTRTRGQAETVPYLMSQLPAWTPKDGGINIYFWYYATLALHMSGAQEFQKWNQSLTKALLTGQTKTGPAAGSWDPVDVLGERGGRIYSTATATLCLEVYYRYLPFYKQR